MSSDDVLEPNRDGARDPDPDEGRYPTVGDPEDIAQKRSHQRVQALLDEVTNTQIREANDLEGEHPAAQHRRAYHGTVVELWRELQPTLRDASDDVEHHYWFDIDLGSFRVEPPAPLRPPETRGERERWPDLRPGASWAEPVSYEIQGFRQFAEIDVVVRTRYSVRFDEDSITVPDLRERIARDDPNGNYRVWERDGRDYEQPFQVDKYRLMPKYIINRARGALREFAEESGHGFGKPEYIDEVEMDPV